MFLRVVVKREDVRTAPAEKPWAQSDRIARIPDEVVIEEPDGFLTWSPPGRVRSPEFQAVVCDYDREGRRVVPREEVTDERVLTKIRALNNQLSRERGR